MEPGTLGLLRFLFTSLEGRVAFQLSGIRARKQRPDVLQDIFALLGKCWRITVVYLCNAALEGCE